VSTRLLGNLMKYLLVLAAVLAGDPAIVDPRVEAVTELFDDLAACEAAKERSTGEGKGEIERRKVLRIVGQCQELDAEDLQKLRDILNIKPGG
jgi:hypothetical protein